MLLCHEMSPSKPNTSKVVRGKNENLQLFGKDKKEKCNWVLSFERKKKNPKVFHHNLSIFSFFFFFWKNEEYALRKKRRQLKKRVFLEEV